MRTTWKVIVYVATAIRWVLSRECRYCGGEARRGDTACESCWTGGVSRGFGIEPYE